MRYSGWEVKPDKETRNSYFFEKFIGRRNFGQERRLGWELRPDTV